METLRLPETTSIDVTFSVPDALTNYSMTYVDFNTGISRSASATSNSSELVTFTLDDYYLTYTGTVKTDIYDGSTLVISTGIDIVKPYCDITSVKNKLGITTAQTIQIEKVARKIIESEAGTFNFVRKQKEITGMGLDYLPVDERIVNLYYMYENGDLIYDYEDENLDDYRISIDGTSIVTSVSPVNKMEYQKVWRDRFLDTDFTSGYEYLIDGDFGYQVVPEDIQEVCELLMQDIASNNMRYINRGIEEFDNNEFKIKFAKGYTSGTGNMIADKILAKYKNRIIPGVI
jgi:hypothetical protein